MTRSLPITSRRPSSSKHLGGHAIPIDKAAHRVLERVGISEAEISALRAILERAVPKNRGAEFLDLIEDVANDTCLETDPECPRCELRKVLRIRTDT